MNKLRTEKTQVADFEPDWFTRGHRAPAEGRSAACAPWRDLESPATHGRAATTDNVQQKFRPN